MFINKNKIIISGTVIALFFSAVFFLIIKEIPVPNHKIERVIENERFFK